mmetsp:Transcript_11900/g.39550  ORF Transcript_11900/g.39550 Transcript_11900/m.39550 type:complete len:126 (-) Transcript_11900:1030-1407(-)
MLRGNNRRQTHAGCSACPERKPGSDTHGRTTKPRAVDRECRENFRSVGKKKAKGSRPKRLPKLGILFFGRRGRVEQRSPRLRIRNRYLRKKLGYSRCGTRKLVAISSNKPPTVPHRLSSADALTR